jgi:thiamine biosynthesis lipoprotein ApbE
MPSDTAIDRAKKALIAYDARFSTYRDDSELSEINATVQKNLFPFSETAYLLTNQRNTSRKSEGAIDITILIDCSLEKMEVVKSTSKEGKSTSDKNTVGCKR